MGASASLSQVALAVEPGGQTSCDIRVRNTGQVVDEFTIDVVGFPEDWATAEPAMLRLFPGAEDTSHITFSPPRLPSVTAGQHPFAVRVISKEDGPGSAVEEGVIDVARFVDITTELIPKTSRGARRASHELAVDNRGNSRLEGEVTVIDPDGLLKYEVIPPVVSSDPGTATFLQVRLKPKDTYLRGPNKTLPFQTVVTAEGAEPAYADGSMLQQQILPRWLVPAIMAFILLAILLVVLWFTVFKPVVNSSARAAVVEELDETQLAAEQAAEAAQEAQATANSVAEDAEDGVLGNEDGDGDGDGDGTTTTITVPPDGVTTTTVAALPGILALGDQIDFRIQADANANSPGSFPVFEFNAQPSDKVLLITDVVFQNPNSDVGTLRLLREGTILLEIGLQNFRDLDYHFIAPLKFNVGESVQLAVECLNPSDDCTPAAYFAGVAAEPPPA